MNTKNLLLGILVLLTMVFASLAFIEYEQVSTVTATSIQIGQNPLNGAAGISLSGFYEKVDKQHLYIRVPASHSPANKTLNIDISHNAAAFICGTYLGRRTNGTTCYNTPWNVISKEMSRDTSVCASISSSEDGELYGIKIFFNSVCISVSRPAR